MKARLKKYPLNQCALYKCSTKKKLEYFLKLEKGTIKRIEKMIQYREFSIPKKGSSEMRDITAPAEALKSVQRRILKLLQCIERPEWLISGERGKSYVDNGLAHIASDYMLAVDIKSFYDHCKREAVYRFFRNTMQTTADVAQILTDIITYHGGIPTGCPTSQIIAFYAYENMFYEIASTADRYGCIFTLYVDDMTFSSKKAFDPCKLAREVDIILRKYGHCPKYKKVKYYPRNSAKPVTGTIITKEHRITAPNTLQKNIYEGFLALNTLPEGQTYTVEQTKELAALKGRVYAARNIDKQMFPEIFRKVSAVKT